MTYKLIHKSDNGVKLYGGAREFWQSKHHEIILDGPFETGKTFAVLYKFHNLLIKYPNSQALIVRKVYNDLIKSAIATYENKILPVSPDHPDSFVKRYGGERPTKYIYANGSEVIVAGLDRSESVLSAEFDFIYINQAEEIPQQTYETLVGRATGRAGNAPYSQVMGECNPSFPNHWILEREQKGHLKRFKQLHKHNPVLYNQETGELTEQGKRTMNVLNSLTGMSYQRGVLGLWVAAEGIIYDNFSLEGNVTEEAEYSHDYPVYWGVDDGHAEGQGVGTAGHHPRAVALCNILPGGVVHVFDEYYETLTLAEHSINELLGRPYSHPRLAMVDSSAKDLRMRLSNANVPNGAATHKVKDGIDNMRHFICDGHGVRRLFIHPRCKNLIRELQSYRYNDRATTIEQPLKVDDHACFTEGTMIRTSVGDIPIERLTPQHNVLTRDGHQSIDVIARTDDNAEVYKLTLSNGKELIGTGNHPVWVQGKGFTPLQSLMQSDILYGIDDVEIHEPVQYLVQPIYVTKIERLNQRQVVYNLSVNAVSEYFANGVLVSNCDALRYLLWNFR